MHSSITALLGLAALFVGWILMLVLPGSRFFAWGILALGTALIAGALVADFRRVRGALASGRGKFGVGATLMISLFLGIVLLANAISVDNHHRFDLTVELVVIGAAHDLAGQLHDHDVALGVLLDLQDTLLLVGSVAENAARSPLA